MEAKVTINGIEVIKDLLELLSKYKDELPMELQKSLELMANEGHGDIDNEYITTHYGNAKIEHSLEYEHIMSVNKMLKKVKVFYGGNIKILYPAFFWLKVNDEIIVQW